MARHAPELVAGMDRNTQSYVPVLIRRRVKELLRVQNSTLKIDVFNRPSARVKPII